MKVGQNALMRICEFGHFQAASLVLDEISRAIANDYGLPEGAPCHFRDVKIYSRLGGT